MPGWNDLKKGFGKLADKTATKTKELTDTASLKLKIATKEADRDAEYRALGKLTYQKLKSNESTKAITERISECIINLDRINEELSRLRSEDEERKAAKQASKEAKKAEKAAAEEMDEARAHAEEELIMEQFNKARQEADEEYEKAKKAAEMAKNN